MKFDDYVSCEMEGAVAVVTIDHPPVNSLNLKVTCGLFECFTWLAKEKCPRAVILTGAGKTFVAGADIKELLNCGSDLTGFSERGHELYNLIETFPVPTVAAINGAALGGGLELAICCDILLASETARLGLPETGLGIVPGWGGISRLPKLIGSGKTKKLVFTADSVPASEALEMGLVHEVVLPERLMEHAMATALRIAQNAPIAIREAKKVLNKSSELPLDGAIRQEIEAFRLCGCSNDKTEGIAAFLNKRDSVFTNS